MNLPQGHKWQITVRQEVSPKRSCANSEATKNKWKTPTAAFSLHQGPNSFVSRKVPDYTALIYCLSPKSSQMWSHLHFKYTSSFSIISNASYQTTHVDLILLCRLRTESSKPLNGQRERIHIFVWVFTMHKELNNIPSRWRFFFWSLGCSACKMTMSYFMHDNKVGKSSLNLHRLKK